MKVSVVSGEVGYGPYALDSSVKFDGVHVFGCVSADEEAGEVRGFEGATGFPSHAIVSREKREGTWEVAVAKGRVEIELRSGYVPSATDFWQAKELMDRVIDEAGKCLMDTHPHLLEAIKDMEKMSSKYDGLSRDIPEKTA